jgi:hypothetical protein
VKGSTAHAGKLSTAQATAFKAEGKRLRRKSEKFMVHSLKTKAISRFGNTTFKRQRQLGKLP